MAVFSPNPNILVQPDIQQSFMYPWSPTTQYNYGDCVIGSDGMAYAFLAAFDAGQYPFVGTTSDPTYPGNSLTLSNQRGLLIGGDFNTNYITGATVANPNGAQWINLSLLSPRIPPWNAHTTYSIGDLVYFPTDQPSVVWRLNSPVQAGNPPNVPGLNQIATNQVNNWWGLISNPLQTTAFNPSIPNVYGTNVESFVNQPLPAIRPAPM
jgi:hypothetical protein